MQVKTTPPLHVLVFRTQTSLTELDKYAITVPKRMYAEAARLGLLVSGPLYWRYLGADGRPETIFTLQIGLPVEKPGSLHPADNAGFTFEEWPAFYGLTLVHEGAWTALIFFVVVDA